MNLLTKNELFSICVQLDLKSFLDFSQTEKRIKQLVYDRDEIWTYLLNKEFPDWRNTGWFPEKDNRTFREMYKLLYCLDILSEDTFQTFSFLELYNMEYMELNECEMETIPRKLEVLPELKHIDFTDNLIHDIHRNVCFLTNLTSLLLYENQIQQIPPEIGNLTNLEHLALMANRLEEIPKEIGNLTNLEFLILHYNAIKELPREIGRLSKLKQLNISYNLLEELPVEIGNLSEMFSLEIGFNDILYFPKPICNLTKLQNLEIRDNYITDIPSLDKCTSLEVLDLTSLDISDYSNLLTIKNLRKIIIREERTIPEQLRHLIEIPED